MKRRSLVCALMLLAAGGLQAESSAPPALSIEDAVNAALSSDPAVDSAHWDWLAALSKADASWLRMIPSLTGSAGYMRLSELDPAQLSIGMFTATLPAGLPDVWTLSLNMQYPIFAGFRIREAATIASLTAGTKLITLEMVKRALAFETRRAYWEAVRASATVETLKKNLDLVVYNRKLVNDQAAVGTVTQADLLSADLRVKQAEMDLADGISLQKRAFLTLASLIGKNTNDVNLGANENDALALFRLTTKAEGGIAFDPGMLVDEKKLIDIALSRRPETRMSSLSIEIAEHTASLARAPLYPTLVLSGNYTYANPNQRTPFQTDPTIFTGTWSLGVALSYDFGGLPAAIAETISADKAVVRARSDAVKAGKNVVLDVQNCILAFHRARHNLELLKGMVAQAAENARVTAQRRNAGTASNLDQLTADLALLRAHFAVTNGDINLRIAAADLARALASDDSLTVPADAAQSALTE